MEQVGDLLTFGEQEAVFSGDRPELDGADQVHQDAHRDRAAAHDDGAADAEMLA